MLNAAAEKAGWGKPPPDGVFRGLAQIMGYGSYVAGRVPRCRSATTASSRSTASSPRPIPAMSSTRRRSSAQVAGSFVYGLSAVLYGEITVKGGAVEQTNFDTYNVMRIDEMPKVETVIVPSGDFWGGVGEPTIAVAAPAVLNAIFAATGKRIRTLPLMNHDLKQGVRRCGSFRMPVQAGW